jgi:uncharacterized protein YqfA (UPF0365 family)
MSNLSALFAQAERDPNLLNSGSTIWVLVGGAIAVVVGLILLVVVLTYGKIWFQAYMSNARVSILNLIGMSFRQVNARVIVQSRIMARQAGVGNDPDAPITTKRLEAHYLAGGDVPRVVRAIIAAHRADLDLDFDRAAAIDLAGRDVLDAVQTSVNPKVIDCPDPDSSRKTFLSAIAKNGVELRVRARVTVRTNLQHVGENIGARLRADQAEADTRVARAEAEERRAFAIAREQEMKAAVAQNRARVVLAEAEVPRAMAEAFRQGAFEIASRNGQ